MGWISATGVIQHVHRRLLESPLRHLRCLDPAAAVRRDRPLHHEVSSTTVSAELWRGTADSVWQASIWVNLSRVSQVVSAAQAVNLYAKWLPTQKHLLCQLPSLDGKRLLCHDSVNSPCHVDALITVWRNHRLLVPVRVRSMWQVFLDNLDVLEVCGWTDLQKLTESGLIIARERYERFQVPHSLGTEVMRALQTKALCLGDQIDGYQGVIDPPVFSFGRWSISRWAH